MPTLSYRRLLNWWRAHEQELLKKIAEIFAVVVHPNVALSFCTCLCLSIYKHTIFEDTNLKYAYIAAMLCTM